MNKRKTAQDAKRDLHGILKVKATFLPYSIQEQHTTIELRDQIMIDCIAFFHLAVVDITDDVLVFLRIQFLAELDFIDLLAFK